MVGGGGLGVPKSDFRGNQKSRAISGEMSKYARKCRGKHQRSERTDGTSRETNKYRKFWLCEANKLLCTVNCSIMVIHPPPEAAAKNGVFQ